MNRLRRGKLFGWLAEARDAFAAVFFPAPCRLCGELLARARPLPLCDTCPGSFQPLPDQACDVCGLPLEALSSTGAERLLCAVCRGNFFSFDRARSYAA